MDLGLSGKVVLVTGGSRGIGGAAARLFAREGARVAITYRENGERAERVAMEVEGLAVRFELGEPEMIHAAVGAVLERWGQVDVLVNNAVQWGAWPDEATRFEEVAMSEWRALLLANSAGHYAAIQAVVPSMRQRRWGRIVNVSSTVAADGMKGMAAYGAAKAALHGLTRTLAKELGADGILVNTVLPGLTMTETNREQLPAEVIQGAGAATPIGRLLEPEEVARAMVFLGSAANVAITGEMVRTSGGAVG